MQSWVYIVGIFGLSFIAVIVVGFIGNKAVDKTENALRSNRINRQNNNPAKSCQSESLASRLSATGNAQTPQIHKASFCTVCGEKLDKDSLFCPKCGTKADTYEKQGE